MLGHSRPAPLVARPAALGSTSAAKAKQIPTLEELIDRHDYVGAAMLLEFKLASNETGGATSMSEERTQLRMWLAYAYFHGGEIEKAAGVYESLINDYKSSADANKQRDKLTHYEYLLALCYFHLDKLEEAAQLATRIPDNDPHSSGKSRLLLAISAKSDDEYGGKYNDLMKKLSIDEDPIDRLVVAFTLFLARAYEAAAKLYRELLDQHPEWIALNVYIALCYYKLEFYDISSQYLNAYLYTRPDSAVTANLKASISYKMYDRDSGKTAEAEIKVLQDIIDSKTSTYGEPLLKHNRCVFRVGEDALTVLPPLMDVIPEAKLNLIIHHLRSEQYDASTVTDPKYHIEFILRGLATLMAGQTRENGDRLMALGLDDLRRVGESKSECDTVSGRECMAAVKFIEKVFCRQIRHHVQKWEDVCIYLTSIRNHIAMDDDLTHDALCWNLGVAKIMRGEYDEGYQLIMHIKNEHVKEAFAFQSLCAHVYVCTDKPREAWDIYHKMQDNADVYSMLLLIANDCYATGAYYYAAMAFDILHKLYPNNDYWEGKRGACCGVFRNIVNGKDDPRSLTTIVRLLSNSTHPEASELIKTIRQWANKNNLSGMIE